MNKRFMSLWAKKEERLERFYWLPLKVHLTDTMHVSRWLWNNWLSESQRQFCIIEITKEIISDVFKKYLRGICEIRNLRLKSPVDSYAKSFIDEEIELMYALIEPAFKEWLSLIKPDDSKEAKIKEWLSQLRQMVLNRGEELFENCTARDLKGIKKGERIENIAMKHWQFINDVNNKLGEGAML